MVANYSTKLLISLILVYILYDGNNYYFVLLSINSIAIQYLYCYHLLSVDVKCEYTQSRFWYYYCVLV